MISRTSVVVEANGRLGRVDCQAPLTIRQVRSDDPGTCALCLVGTAAGPLAGDELSLDLVLRAGARATLQAAGASLAQGGGGPRTITASATLATGAVLTARPQPVVVGAGSRLDVAVRLDLAADATIAWHELLVLGRSDEVPGAVTLRWDVERAGRPVLRQFVDLADPGLTGWRAMTGGARVIATTVLSGPELSARTVVASGGPLPAVAARLDEHTALVTVLGTDASSVQRVAAELCASVTGGHARVAAAV